MLYLLNTTYTQSITIPRNDRDACGGEYALSIIDSVDNIERHVSIERLSSGQNYYTLQATLPEGVHRGEYIYILTCGGVVVARGLAFVGDVGVEYLAHDESSEVLDYTEHVEVFQASADVEYIEFDEDDKGGVLIPYMNSAITLFSTTTL